ncbi:ribonuclease HI [Nocardia wallacei]|uniref:ribonuclease HI n=1 Tax=Nocardia wallacei TaxID=480035 RepID=UPI00245657E3|nr:ribonuclease H family protein [Nocardia wallacei]
MNGPDIMFACENRREATRLVVATDGSGRDHGAGGYGWISAEGHYGYGLTVTSESHQSEIIAICTAAVAPELLDRELLILSDSQAAVELLNRCFDHGVGSIRRTSRHPVRWMRQAYEQRHRVRLAWIKGHSGHPLNSAADRLANLAITEGTGMPACHAKDEAELVRELILRGFCP